MRSCESEGEGEDVDTLNEPLSVCIVMLAKSIVICLMSINLFVLY